MHHYLKRTLLYLLKQKYCILIHQKNGDDFTSKLFIKGSGILLNMQYIPDFFRDPILQR